MAYRMVVLQWPWVSLKVTFAISNLCNTYNSYIKCDSTTIYLQTHLQKVHVACNLSFIVKNGVFKVIVSHVHFKSGSISGTELDRNIVTTGHQHDVIFRPTYKHNYDDLRRMNFKAICQLQLLSNGMFCNCRICTDKHITQSLCNSFLVFIPLARLDIVSLCTKFDSCSFSRSWDMDGAPKI